MEKIFVQLIKVKILRHYAFNECYSLLFIKPLTFLHSYKQMRRYNKMIDNRLNKVLTTIIIISLIGIFIVMGFWGYDIFQKYYIKNGAENAVDEFDKKINENNQITESENTNSNSNLNSISNSNTSNSSNKNRSITSKKIVQMKYKGFDVVRKN